jgi:thiamine biosynthesis lipoprotein
MIPHLSAVLTVSLLAAPIVAQELESDGRGAAGPVRLAASVFGASAEIEVRDLPTGAAEELIEDALAEIHALSLLTDPDGTAPGGLGPLNQAAGGGARPVEPRLGELLLRSLQFCIWSNGAYGPLGGELYRLWKELEAKGERPTPSDLRRSVGSAECARLALDGSGAEGAWTSAALAAGSRVDLRGIARGFAVDRAAEILEGGGARDYWVEIDNVWRARGEGPDGRGWLAVLPPPPGGDEPLDRIWLRDQALAFFSVQPLRGVVRDPFIDQRSGVPASGVVTVVAVTRLAVDAEPLVSSLFVLGHRDGLMKLGVLSPRPSVLWLLGQGSGTPLEASYRWTELDRMWRR